MSQFEKNHEQCDGLKLQVIKRPYTALHVEDHLTYTKLEILQNTKTYGTSLAVQWLRFCASNAGGMGSIPGRGTKIPHVADTAKKKKKYKDLVLRGTALNGQY